MQKLMASILGRRVYYVLMQFSWLQSLGAGFGNYLARPLFRERHSPDMSEAEATKLMHDALRVRVKQKHKSKP